jgi:hypothetical protein
MQGRHDGIAALLRAEDADDLLLAVPVGCTREVHMLLVGTGHGLQDLDTGESYGSPLAAQSHWASYRNVHFL